MLSMTEITIVKSQYIKQLNLRDIKYRKTENIKKISTDQIFYHNLCTIFFYKTLVYSKKDILNFSILHIFFKKIQKNF
jgi:hypothetical protein